MGKPRLGKRERAEKRKRLLAEKQLAYSRLSEARAMRQPNQLSGLTIITGDGRLRRLSLGFSNSAPLSPDILKGKSHYKGCSAGGARGMGKPKAKKPLPDRFLPGHMARGHEDLATDNRPQGERTKAKIQEARLELRKAIINSL